MPQSEAGEMIEPSVFFIFFVQLRSRHWSQDAVERIENFRLIHEIKNVFKHARAIRVESNDKVSDHTHPARMNSMNRFLKGDAEINFLSHLK